MGPNQVAGNIQRAARTAAAARACRPAVEYLNLQVRQARELLKQTGRVNAGPGQIAAGQKVVPRDLGLFHAALAPGGMGRKEIGSTVRWLLFFRARVRSGGTPF